MKARNLIISLSLLTTFSAFAGPGNGAPSGSHFNLNIIGTKTKTADISTGNRIFMPLFGKSKILLQEGADFAVIDGNGTDGSAKFQLPNPDPENDGITEYSVFARPLGKPGGAASLTTCAIDKVTLEEVCSLNTSVFVRSGGKQSFSNVSGDLLYIYADLDADGVVERVPLFDDRLQDYFWSYDNKGLRVLQLRFYQISTNVN